MSFTERLILPAYEYAISRQDVKTLREEGRFVNKFLYREMALIYLAFYGSSQLAFEPVGKD